MGLSALRIDEQYWLKVVAGGVRWKMMTGLCLKGFMLLPDQEFLDTDRSGKAIFLRS